MPRPHRSLLKFGVTGVLALQALGGSDSAVAVTQSDANAAAGSAAVTQASARALRLPSASRCVRGGRLRILIVPPSGGALSSVRVFADGAERVQLSGVFLRTRVTVPLSGGSTRVRVSGRTISGELLGRARSYRSCGVSDEPADSPSPIIYEGGGED